MKLSERFPLWKRASLYLALLAAFFFVSYGAANRYAASLDFVPSVSYSWEKYIPFLPWTLIPYWSMDLLYGISFFLCASKKELTVHAARLFVASCFCCLCFVLFPLACTADIPSVSNPLLRCLLSGGGLVATPFNQAPSLHIALAWLVWLRFRAHTCGFLKTACGVWFLLIGLSVLTCYQHHFIDVPLGFFAGVLISYLLPMRSYSRTVSPDVLRRLKLAGYYFAGSFLFAAAAWHFKGAALWLFWPALSLCLVGWGYSLWGTAVFQKNDEGSLSLSARILLAPYRLGAFLSRCYFSRKLPQTVQIADGIFSGGFPSNGRIAQDGLLDLTAEFDSSSVRCRRKICCPRMDLVSQTPEQIRQAVGAVSDLATEGSVLVCCALGLSRSAAVAAAYLAAQRKESVTRAVQQIIRLRPQAVLTKRQMFCLLDWEKLYNEANCVKKEKV